MRDTRPVTREVSSEETTAVRCDRCGKSILLGAEPKFVEGGTVALRFGYGSGYDQYSHEQEREDTYDICDDCVPDLRAWLTVARRMPG